MGDKKHYVFSARTTEEGLKILNMIREEQKLSWDELIIPAINAHYNVHVSMIEKAPVDQAKLKAKEDKAAAKAQAKAEREAKVKANAEAKAGAKKEREAKAAKAKADKARAKAKAKAEADKHDAKVNAARAAEKAAATTEPIVEPAEPTSGHE